MSSSSSTLIDAWQERWSELEKSPQTKWKLHELFNFDRFHAQLLDTVLSGTGGIEGKRIVVPLAGDCLAVKTFAVDRKCSVAAIEFVPRACELLQERFVGTDVAFDEPVQLRDNVLLRKGEAASTGAQVRVFQCDVFEPLSEVFNWADVLYDKDAFGALHPVQRAPYVQVVSKYLQPGGILLLAGAFRVIDAEKGPPFSLTRELVLSQWCAGGDFQLIGEPREREYNTVEERFHDITYILQKKKESTSGAEEEEKV
jgi:hypothetical protein